jgi:hypothetical protein
MQFICDCCEKSYEAKQSEKTFAHSFCSRECYHQWRSNKSIYNKGEKEKGYTKYFRLIWGGAGIGRQDPFTARKVGKIYEEIAVNMILPKEGFTDIINLSACSNQFYIDFIATKDGVKVLIDATIKYKAHIPQKVFLAKSLGMPLYILHISPRDTEIYYLVKIPYTQTTSKVPNHIFHEIKERCGIVYDKSPDPTYQTGTRVERIIKLCKQCGATMEVPKWLENRKQFCSKQCQGKFYIKSHLKQYMVDQ